MVTFKCPFCKLNRADCKCSDGKKNLEVVMAKTLAMRRIDEAVERATSGISADRQREGQCDTPDVSEQGGGRSKKGFMLR